MLILDPLQDGKSKLALIDWMGDDLSVVNDARASFNRHSEVFGPRDESLINRLISGIDEPQHTSPLRGTVFKFRITAPLFVGRQWFKHALASCHTEEQLQWNEQSLRFTEIVEPEFYCPAVFKTQSTINKQSSAEPIANQSEASRLWLKGCADSFNAYRALIDLGVSREQARCKLSPDLYVTWVWTCSLQAVLNFIDLREGHGAQNEISAYAECIKSLIQPKIPSVFTAWETRKQIIREAMELWRMADAED